MDDEIDIEEHDILEHPQVKATFPDLTRIQIEVHASGAAFSEDAIDLCNEESTEDFLRERRNYTESSQDDVEVRQDDLQSSEDDSNSQARQDDDQSNPEEIQVQRYTEDSGQDYPEVRQEEMQSYSEKFQDSREIPDTELEFENTHLEQEYTEIRQEYAEVNQNGAITEQDSIREKLRNNLQECERFEELMEENIDLTEVIEIPDDEDPQVLGDLEPQTLTDVEPQMLTDIEPRIFEDTYKIGSLSITENELIVPDVTDGVENQNIDLTESDNNECLDLQDNLYLTDIQEECETIADEIDQSANLRDGTTNYNIEKDFEENPASLENNDTDPKENNAGFEEFTENHEDFDPKENNDGLEEIPENAENNEEEIEYSDPDQCDDVPIKEEVDDWYEFSDFNESVSAAKYKYHEEVELEDMYCFKNKIILGSKPTPTIDINCEDLMTAKILLEDWGARLENSDSFCKDCLRLFTTPNALDAHKMISHSLLTPITNRAVKSTAKSHIVNSTNKHTARKSTSLASNSTYCNHCNKTFTDRTSLITHLYELLPSKNYSCTVCDAKFQNQNDLVKHNEVHVKTESKILKPKSNPILKKLLKKKQSLPVVRTVTPVVIKKELSESNCVFKCVLCSEVLECYSHARYHRQNVHPDTANKMIFKRMLPKKHAKDRLVFEKTKAKVKKVDTEDVKVAEDYDLVPKSALFKCSDCNVHFLSSYAGVAHYLHQNCQADTSLLNNKYKLWQCSTCKRKLRKNDKEYHQIQHKISSKFKIYVVTKTLNERTLYKCSKCNVHFDYISFKPHLAKCGKLLTVKCQQCNILIRKQKEAEHQAKHSYRKLKPKDFIIIDYAVLKKSESKAIVNQTGEKNVKEAAVASKNKILVGKIEPKLTKVKIEPGAVKRTKLINRLKFEPNKIKMFYCKHCKNFVHYRTRTNIARSMKCHASKSCSDRGHICDKCGLRVTSRKSAIDSHKIMHKERHITLKDFQFIDIRTKKQIIPEIPKYFACQTCNIYFLDSTYLKNHICGEDYENCDVCGDKYEMTALALHRPFHDLQKTNAQSQKTPEPDNTIPELIMKYESLNAIWNILFICGRCDLVTDVYNKAVEHSQAHLDHKHSTKTIKCYICNLKFDENCWSKHSELHSRMALNNKDFKILKYDPKTLLDESWFQMFDSLPESEIRQILDRSVFGNERGMKMQLVKDGLPEFTIHCCSECEVAFDSNDIRSHVNSPCKLSAHICIKCNIAFGKSNSLAFHELLHKKGIKTNEFRVVNFVKDSVVASKTKKVPKEIKAKVTNAKVTIAKVQKETKSNAEDVQNPNAKYVLHKCKLCSSCLHSAGWARGHKCSKEKLVFCHNCLQHFSRKMITPHSSKHTMYSDYTFDNIHILEFEPSINTERENAIVTTVQNKERKTLNSSKNRLNNSEIEQDTTKDQPNKRKTLNSSKNISLDIEDTNEIDTDKNMNNSVMEQNTTRETPYKRKTLNSTKHDLTDNDTSVDSIEQVAKVYKCDCGLHYTSLGSIEKHIETCAEIDGISKENCSKCGLLFPTDILVSHLCKHHSNLHIVVKVEEVHKKIKSPTKSKDTNKKLYKCSSCNVYFLNQYSCYKHITKHEALDPKEYIECKMCSLQFRILTLHVHIKKHHQKEFDLQTVLVEEYQPSVGKDAPKIEVYFASEKCQSVQVSSSNDD